MSSFIKIGDTLAENGLNLSLYQCKSSGINVAIIDKETPFVKVQTFFVTPEDDFLLNETLTCLLSYGSRNYPYIGYLKALAERFYGKYERLLVEDGSLREELSFSLQVLSEENFLQILPVYLDHLLNPLLRKEAYTTRISNGELNFPSFYDSAKTVNCDDYIVLRRLIYGNTVDSEYKSYDDYMNNFEDYCCLEKIKKFHQDYYKMNNAFMCITGTVNHQDVLGVIHQFGLTNEVERSEYKRLSVYSPIRRRLERVRMPRRTKNEVRICWRGPEYHNEDWLALKMLVSYYLNGTSKGSLNSFYVNVKPIICSKISACHHNIDPCSFGFIFYDVREEFLSKENESLFQEDLLTMIRDYQFSMKTMECVLQRYSRDFIREIETDSDEFVVKRVSIYSKYYNSSGIHDIGILRKNDLEIYEKLKGYDEAYWVNLIKKYFTDDFIIIYCEVEPTLPRMKEEEPAFQNEEKEEEYLPARLFCVENEVNEDEDLKDYIPSPLDISSIKSTRRHIYYHNRLGIPIIHHENNSTFIRFKLIFDLNKLPEVYYPFLLLYINDFLNCRVIMKKSQFPLTAFFASLMGEISFVKLNCESNLLTMEIDVTEENLDKIGKWYGTLLKDIEMIIPYLKQELTYLTNKCEEYMDSEDEIFESYRGLCTMKEGTAEHYFDYIRMGHFYKKIIVQMKSHRKIEKALVDYMNELKEEIPDLPANLHIYGKKDCMKKINFENWPKLRNSGVIYRKSKDIYDYSLLAGLTRCIISKKIKNSKLCQFIQIPYSLKDKEFVYLILFYRYLSLVINEDNDFELDPRGITFTLTNIINLKQTYNSLKSAFLAGINTEIDAKIFNKAKKLIIKEYIEEIVGESENYSMDNHLNRFYETESFALFVVETVDKASPEDITPPIKQHFIDLFDDKKCGRLIITNNSSTIKECGFSNITFDDITLLSKDVRITILTEKNCDREMNVIS